MQSESHDTEMYRAYSATDRPMVSIDVCTNRTKRPFLAASEIMLLAVTVAACGQGDNQGTDLSLGSSGTYASNASISASATANDPEQTISYALAVAAGDQSASVAPGGEMSTSEAAASAEAPDLGSALPDNEIDSDSSSPDSNSSSESMAVDGTQNVPTQSTDGLDIADEVDIAAVSVDSEPQAIEPGTTDFIAIESITSDAESSESPAGSSDNQGGSDAEPTMTDVSESSDSVDNSGEADTASSGNAGTSSSSDNQYTRFESVTTSGFTGRQLDQETIQVTWQADPNARGYNVYKQAQFVESVFTTEFVDKDVYNGGHYYEIQAFDHADDLYYVATGLTVSVSDSNHENPEAAPANADMLADYTLVFADEFNGPTLDSSRWNTAYLWGDDLVINSEEQHYVDLNNEPDFGFNPFTFNGETLTINSIRTPEELLGKANGQRYLSGVITSYDAFKFTYGYVEARAKMTHGRGYWPAFWLLNAYYVDDKPEIDIMEFIGDNQDVVYHTYHYYDGNGELRSTHSEPTVGIDFTSDFHTFAVDWRPGTLVFYVDGNEVHRISDPKVSQQEMYVIANTAIGGWWPGCPDETTPFPGKYEIDYIRVYQRNTPYSDDPFLHDQPSTIPFADEVPSSPNHRPTREQWPEGYPDGL